MARCRARRDASRRAAGVRQIAAPSAGAEPRPSSAPRRQSSRASWPSPPTPSSRSITASGSFISTTARKRCSGTRRATRSDATSPSCFRRGSAPVHDAHIESFARSAVTARRMGERREIFGLRADGTEFPAEASISKLVTPDGLLFTVVMRDTTVQRRAEEDERFLSGASGELSNTLAVDATERAIVDLPIPRLADAALLDLVAPQSARGDGVHACRQHAPARRADARRSTRWRRTASRRTLPRRSSTSSGAGEPELRRDDRRRLAREQRRSRIRSALASDRRHLDPRASTRRRRDARRAHAHPRRVRGPLRPATARARREVRPRVGDRAAERPALRRGPSREPGA